MAGSLPTEILVEILSYVLHSDTVNILLTSRLFYSIGQVLLHQDLTFTSIAKLHRFSESLSNRTSSSKRYLVCSPRSLTLDIAGGASWITASHTNDSMSYRLGTWLALRNALNAILNDLDPREVGSLGQNERRLVVDAVQLRLNSHTNDANSIIYDALCLLNAKSFSWHGPDPPHHFSTAIVMQATPYLFRALATHTQLTYVKLTNISFPEIGVSTSGVVRPFNIPFIPSLQHLYLGQSTFLAAHTLARFLLFSLYPDSQARTIQKVHLVDIYEGSIWGPRLRMPRIIGAAQALLSMEQQASQTQPSEGDIQRRIDELSEAIENLVSVMVETERIEGGDRGY